MPGPEHQFFEPPIPMRMGAYLDEVTGGKVRHIRSLSVFQLDEALQLIRSRPTIGERAALLGELEKRLMEYGRATWKPDTSKKSVEKEIVSFIVEDIFGLEKKGPGDQVKDQFQSKLEEGIRQGLNARGKRYLSTLQFLYELLNAKSEEEALRVLAEHGISVLNVHHLQKMMKWVKVPRHVRDRLLKTIATSLLWEKVALTATAWSRLWNHPIVIGLQILANPETTATDEQEEQLTFSLLYGKVKAAPTTMFDDIVLDTPGGMWRFRMNPVEALGKHLPNNSARRGGSASTQSSGDSGSPTSGDSASPTPVDIRLP